KDALEHTGFAPKKDGEEHVEWNYN
uniref:Calcium-binding shell glycoprotein P50 (Fragments) n=2 Tax=Unio pictorum TaxID=55837 RepID=CBG50_UNIPI|nr:RecName: Full=Calcium-binding shell glycoprotein P50 [Unio pictorum]